MPIVLVKVRPWYCRRSRGTPWHEVYPRSPTKPLTHSHTCTRAQARLLYNKATSLQASAGTADVDLGQWWTSITSRAVHNRDAGLGIPGWARRRMSKAEQAKRDRRKKDTTKGKVMCSANQDPIGVSAALTSTAGAALVVVCLAGLLAALSHRRLRSYSDRRIC